MQFGQVPIQFIPEAPVINTNANTMPVEPAGDMITPSRPGEAPAPVVVAEERPPVGTFLAIGALLVFAWLMSRG